MTGMKFLKQILLLFVLLGAVAGYAQDQVLEIRPKRTLWIPKLDLFWAGAVIADEFPTFFPLELELNFPQARISVSGIFSPWFERFTASQNSSIARSTLIGGVGLRYYAFGTQGVAGQGFFVEPQFFRRWNKEVFTLKANGSIIISETTTIKNEIAVMGAVGYQRHFGERFYAQGRVSVGYSDTEIMRGFRSDKLLFLPWLGIGVGF